MARLMSEASDREFVEAIHGGDREAFGQLLERHHASAYRLCRRMTTNPVDAEDLCHQAFVEAYLKLGQLRDPDRFAGWLRTLVLNVCRMWHRRRRRAEVQADGDTDLAAPDRESTQERDAWLAQVLTRTAASQRLVLVLHYLEGLSYKEMAAFLGVPVGTVMSRLHRARGALREAMNESMDHEDVAPTDDFRGDVDAEIALVLRMFSDKPEAAKRLDIIFQRTPERIEELIRHADAESIDHLAKLLPRLGAPALRAAVAACGSADATLRAPAETVLTRSVALCNPRGPHGSVSGYMPPRYLYRMLDAVFESDLDTSGQAGLIERSIDAATDDVSAALLDSAFQCFPEEAFSRLWARFEVARDQEELFRTPDVLYGLCRSAQRFADALVPMLEGDDARRVRLALAGVEGLGRSLRMWLNVQGEESSDGALAADVEERLYVNERRQRRKWPLLRAEDVGRESLESLAAPVVTVLHRTEASHREAALRGLGLLKVPTHLDAIRAAASDSESSVRTAALVALGEMADAEAGDLVLRAAESSDAAERRAAVEVLSRLKPGGALERLLALIDDKDASVRRSAVVALGEFDEARPRLEAVLRGGDRNLARAAADALMGGRRSNRGPLDATVKRKERAGLGGRPIARISADTALRFAMPELRVYEHKELTERLAAVCSDYSSTRRYLVEEGLLERVGDTYTPTADGEVAWRVEHRILADGLAVR